MRIRLTLAHRCRLCQRRSPFHHLMAEAPAPARWTRVSPRVTIRPVTSMSERTSVCKLPDNYDTVVVGGGFYGCTLALNRARSLSERTLLVECGNELLGRASYVNQARVHMGYHYPRSLLTGYRSRANFERFVNEFRDCVERDFTSYYAVARLFSKVTAGQFALFCRRIDAPLTEAPPEVVRLFNPNLVESVFTATEAVFNASKLRHRMRTQLAKYGVEVLLRSKVEKVHCISSGILGVEVRNGVTSTRLRSPARLQLHLLPAE